MAGLDLTKAELNKMIKDAVQAEIGGSTSSKKVMTKEETKALIADTLADFFKFMWQKSGMWTKNI